jgi:hypothetical protein
MPLSEYFGKVESLSKVLRPVKTMMDLLESDDCTLSDVFSGWIVYGAYLYVTEDLPRGLKNVLIAGYNKRFKELMEVEYGIALLAFFLNPQFHKRGMKQSNLELMERCAAEIWKRRGKSKQATRMLLIDFKKYWAGLGNWSTEDYNVEEIAPKQFVRALPCSSEFVELWDLCIDIRPHSAGVERFFSWGGTDLYQSEE